MIYAEESHAALYTQDSDTCVVLLPGFGYSFERPLLQAARKLALQAGFDVLCLSFGELPYDKQRMKESVADCLPLACKRAAALLTQLPHAHRIWIAKSFGTIVAGSLRKADERCVMLTPAGTDLSLYTSGRCGLLWRSRSVSERSRSELAEPLPGFVPALSWS